MTASQRMRDQTRRFVHETCATISQHSPVYVRLEPYDPFSWRVQVGTGCTYGKSFDHTTSEHALCFLDGLTEALKLTGDWKQE